MTEQNATPHPAPAWPPMRFVGWSVDRVDGSSSFGTFDRRETADEWCERLRGYGNDVHVVRYEVPDEMAVLSGRLRGMARRVGKHRAAFKTLRQHMIRVGGKIEQERDQARAELARLRPVVDAAREVAESWDRGEWRTGPRGTEVMQKLASAVETADILADPDTMDAIAEGQASAPIADGASPDAMRWSPLDGDAAATPQPADEESSNVGVLDWALQIAAANGYVAVREPVYKQQMGRSAAPPVDITARLAELAERVDQAGALARLPADDLKQIAADVRALASPSTDTTPGGDR